MNRYTRKGAAAHKAELAENVYCLDTHDFVVALLGDRPILAGARPEHRPMIVTLLRQLARRAIDDLRAGGELPHDGDVRAQLTDPPGTFVEVVPIADGGEAVN